MKKIAYMLCLGFVAGFCGENKVLVGRDTITFSAKLAATTLKKRVELKREIFATSPFKYSKAYDTTRLRIYEIKSPAAPGDTVSGAEAGVLSSRWGVQEESRARYRNISDLKLLGPDKIDFETLKFWIIGGFEVRLKSQFKNYYAELRRSGIVKGNPPPDFELYEQKDAQGHRYLSATLFINFKFIKFHYLVSPDNEVMLLKRKILVENKPVELIPNSGSPGQFFLKSAGDSVALAKQIQYRDITDKYRDALLK